jgi:hypothetical protein
MRDTQPFLIAIGLLCVWPMFWVFVYHMIRYYATRVRISFDERPPKQPPIELKPKARAISQAAPPSPALQTNEGMGD